MPRIELAYGKSKTAADIPWGRPLGVLDIAETPPLADPAAAVHAALDRPIGQEGPAFADFQAGETICIITSDSFRTTRADQYLPPLIDRLTARGVRDEDICFLIATGTHRGPTDPELDVILGAGVHARFKGRIFVNDAHNAEEHIDVGRTSRGTPVELDRRAVEADRVIVTGSVVLHYFGGFGGGRKAVLPGIASVESISKNHSMNLDPDEDRLNPNVAIGKCGGNPVAEDMLEGASFLKVDFLINSVLDRGGRIAGVFAGDFEQAHDAACAFARDLFALPIAEPADVVIASSGAIKNFVQTHKCLFNAYQAVKPNGRIVMLAQCPEGLGGDQFQKWLRLGTREAIIAGLRARAEINGQTALSTIQKAPITTFVTDMDEAEVALLRGRKAPSLEAALETVRAELAAEGIEAPSYYVMPSSAYTVPFLPAEASV